jgi:hypothetical protein
MVMAIFERKVRSRHGASRAVTRNLNVCFHVSDRNLCGARQLAEISWRIPNWRDSDPASRVESRRVAAIAYFTSCLQARLIPKLGTVMTQYLSDDAVIAEVETLRGALPTWIVSTVELVELAENAERAARPANPETLDRSRKLIVEIAEWQEKLGNWQAQHLSPRLLAELRILKSTLDASMDEANAAASKLRLFD